MEDKDLDSQTERMLNAAMGGLTPHQALVKASLEDAAKIAERKAAIEKNKERALKLLAAIEKSQEKT